MCFYIFLKQMSYTRIYINFANFDSEFGIAALVNKLVPYAWPSSSHL